MTTTPEIPPLSQRLGVTKGKAILVGVLGVAFVGVVISLVQGAPEAVQLSKKATDRKPPTARSAVANPITKPARQPVRAARSAVQSVKAATSNRTSAHTTSRKIGKRVKLASAVKAEPVRPATSIAWPVVSVPQATVHDPFAMPVSLRTPKKPKSSADDIKKARELKLSQSRELQLIEAQRRNRLAIEAASEFAVQGIEKQIVAAAQLDSKQRRELQEKIKRERAKEAQRIEAIENARLNHEKKVAADQARIKQQIEQLQNKGVGIVLVYRGTRVVQIGSDKYSEGESFDGILIAEIKSNGNIVLQPMPPKPFEIPAALRRQRGSNKERNSNQ